MSSLITLNSSSFFSSNTNFIERGHRGHTIESMSRGRISRGRSLESTNRRRTKSSSRSRGERVIQLIDVEALHDGRSRQSRRSRSRQSSRQFSFDDIHVGRRRRGRSRDYIDSRYIDEGDFGYDLGNESRGRSITRSSRVKRTYLRGTHGIDNEAYA